MLSRSADDLPDSVPVNVADGELLQVGGEAATGFHLAAGIDDERLAGPFAIVLLEPDAVPTSGEALGSLHGRQVVPVQCDGKVGSHQQISMHEVGPFTLAGQFPTLTP